MVQMTTGEVAAAVGGELIGAPDLTIRGVAPLETARPDELSFVANARYLRYLPRTRAGAVLLARSVENPGSGDVATILVDDPHVAVYHVLRRLYPPVRSDGVIHPSAVVDASAVIGADVTIGACAVVAAGVRIGARSSVAPHAVLGAGATIGEDCVIHAHVTIHPGVVMGARCIIHSGARVGREGFGFVWLDGGHRRVPQIGGCVLEDDVEIGANSTVDRGSVGDTVIGAGTKIDNLVHLGHNVRVGRDAMIIAQVGVSGSTTIGDGAVLAGQAGVGGHLEIGAGARIGGQAGVTADVPAGQSYSGYPARPHREALRAQGAMFRLPDLIRRMRQLETAVLGRSKEP